MNVFDLFARLTVDDSEYDDKLSKAQKTFGVAAKAIGAAVGAAATAIGKLTKDAVASYANYEQLVGGVETLFKESAGKVRQYAAEAYKTAGLSANEYMDTVTSFSASLIQSLGGDTELAADLADRAISDMSDNANKMGTDMTAIQNAYNGFAKQNYTMLDNLKLGYGGTQEEMRRLIEDAAKMTEVQNELNVAVQAGDMSFGNIVNAISVVQKSLGIMGTTAQETEKTISGSLAAMRSAWANLLTGIADENADFEKLLDDFIDSAEIAAHNVIPRVEQALQGIGVVVTRLGPVIAAEIPRLVEILTPPLLTAALQLVSALVDALPEIAASLVEAVLSLVDTVGDALAQKFPALAVIFENLEYIVIGLTAAFIAYKAALVVMTALTNAATLAEAGLAAAQAALNAVMALNPIGLMIAAIVALTAVLIALWKHSEEFRDFVEFTLDMIGEGVENTVKAIQSALETVSGFFKRLWDDAMRWVADFAHIGQYIVEGITDGIKQAWQSFIDWWNSLWGGLIDGAKDILGIHSPSKVFADIGRNMALGVGEGWDRAFSGIEGGINGSLDFGAGMPASSSAGIASYGGTGGSLSGEQTIRVEFTLRLDDGTVLQKMAHKLYPYMSEESMLGGGVLA